MIMHSVNINFYCVPFLDENKNTHQRKLWTIGFLKRLDETNTVSKNNFARTCQEGDLPHFFNRINLLKSISVPSTINFPASMKNLSRSIYI